MVDQPSASRDELLEQQRALAEFGGFALKAENLDDILNQACHLVGRGLSTDLAKVVELHPDSMTMKVRAGVGWKPGVVGEVTVTADENSPEGLTLKDGAVISPDIEREKRFEYHDFMKDHGVKAFVNVLILSSNGRPPFGVLQVDSRKQRNFTQSDVEFLQTYANLLGAAIERLRVVEELRRALRDKDLLIGELNHRVKNTLATVQSIASQTLRTAPTVDHASTAIEGRLLALSKVHDVLTVQSWASVDLREIVRQAIEPYRDRAQNRIHLQGPSVPVPPRMALALAMALQELATNAVKYGALSNGAGQVAVHWTLDGEAPPGRLQLTWTEVKGPPVQKPKRRGFGTRLIERSLAQDLDGIVRIEFAPAGIVCSVDAPLTS
ncbi:two-component sensor histidine kinase [Microvirga flocculans]|uniref:histidine kinase n=1 Tax=Microvirga flocculans TaxID=217168 RepID=A0A7W6IFA0_9HYPH|nr:HWE histidine kinase domain-containing protein [Microvirga flocculans]MBB4039820.1 two-component sensor histidine kinase [Microvirga flocculans]